jgi:hypothetical protein
LYHNYQNKKPRIYRDLYKISSYLPVTLIENGISFGGKHLFSLQTIKLNTPFKTVDAVDFNDIF